MTSCPAVSVLPVFLSHVHRLSYGHLRLRAPTAMGYLRLGWAGTYLRASVFCMYYFSRLGEKVGEKVVRVEII